MQKDEKSVIDNLTDAEINNIISGGIDTDVDYNNDAEDFDSSYEDEFDSIDFYQTRDSNEIIDKSELLNMLKSRIVTKRSVHGTVIAATDKEYVVVNGSAINTPIAICQLNKPFDNYYVYVPFAYFFAETEQPFIRMELAKRGVENKDRETKKLYSLQYYINAPVNITLIGYNKTDKVFYGSRIEALERAEKNFFNKGRIVNGQKKVATKGSIMYNATVIYVQDNYACVEVAGIPTYMTKKDLSYLNILSVHQILKMGDKIDVMITDISINPKTNRRTLKASVRGTLAIDPTLTALNKAPVGYKGKVSAIVTACKPDPEKYCIFLATAFGYNAIALSFRAYLGGKYGENPLKNKLPTPGTKVTFLPFKKYSNVMIGIITDING